MSYASRQLQIDNRLGQIGASVGQPYTAYRVGAASSGDFSAGWQSLGPTNAYRYRVPVAKEEASVERTGILFDVFLNAGNYKLGDVFVCTDPALFPGSSYGSGATILPSTLQINAFVLVWHAPMRVPTGARLDRRAGIYRPSTAPKTMPDGSKYWAETNDNDLPLILSGGAYSFGGAGAGRASWAPIGLMSVTRRSDYPMMKEPGIVRSLAWMAYIPPLPGYEASEGDALITEDGARYVMLGSFNQEAGVVGSFMICDRKISQTA